MCTRRAPGAWSDQMVVWSDQMVPPAAAAVPPAAAVAHRRCGHAIGRLQTRAPGAAEHRYVHVRPQVRAALRICRGPEARGQGAMLH